MVAAPRKLVSRLAALPALIPFARRPYLLLGRQHGRWRPRAGRITLPANTYAPVTTPASFDLGHRDRSASVLPCRRPSDRSWSWGAASATQQRHTHGRSLAASPARVCADRVSQLRAHARQRRDSPGPHGPRVRREHQRRNVKSPAASRRFIIRPPARGRRVPRPRCRAFIIPGACPCRWPRYHRRFQPEPQGRRAKARALPSPVPFQGTSPFHRKRAHRVSLGRHAGDSHTPSGRHSVGQPGSGPWRRRLGGFEPASRRRAFRAQRALHVGRTGAEGAEPLAARSLHALPYQQRGIPSVAKWIHVGGKSATKVPGLGTRAIATVRLHLQLALPGSEQQRGDLRRSGARARPYPAGRRLQGPSRTHQTAGRALSPFLRTTTRTASSSAN